MDTHRKYEKKVNINNFELIRSNVDDEVEMKLDGRKGCAYAGWIRRRD